MRDPELRQAYAQPGSLQLQGSALRLVRTDHSDSLAHVDHVGEQLTKEVSLDRHSCAWRYNEGAKRCPEEPLSVTCDTDENVSRWVRTTL